MTKQIKFGKHATLRLLILWCQICCVVVRPVGINQILESQQAIGQRRITGMSLMQVQDTTQKIYVRPGQVSINRSVGIGNSQQIQNIQSKDTNFSPEAAVITEDQAKSRVFSQISGFNNKNDDYGQSPPLAAAADSIGSQNLGVINDIQPPAQFSDQSQVLIVPNQISMSERKPGGGTLSIVTGSGTSPSPVSVTTNNKGSIQIEAIIDNQMQTLNLVPQSSPQPSFQSVQNIISQSSVGQQRSVGGSQQQSASDSSLFITPQPSNIQNCPAQSIAQQQCLFQQDQSDSPTVTQLYKFLAGSCNYFDINGFATQPSGQFDDAVGHLDCCSQLQSMWQNTKQRQTITFCSCNQNFKCNENFSVLGPQHGSTLADLYKYCQIPLDLSSVTCI